MYIQLHVHCILIQLHPKKSMGDYITGTCPNCYGTKLVENLDELSPTQSGWLYRPVDGLVFIRYYHPASIADLELVMESTNSSVTFSSLINSDGKPEEE